MLFLGEGKYLTKASSLDEEKYEYPTYCFVGVHSILIATLSCSLSDNHSANFLLFFINGLNNRKWTSLRFCFIVDKTSSNLEPRSLSDILCASSKITSFKFLIQAWLFLTKISSFSGVDIKISICFLVKSSSSILSISQKGTTVSIL